MMITILTPSYNRAYILEKAYKSLLNQTNKDFEWIIVDDGSTDHTKEVVNKWIKEDQLKIKYFFKKNGGKHSALNYGIKKASGTYLLILDSDDQLLDHCIELILTYWKKYEQNKTICCLSFLKVYPDMKVIKNNFFKNETISNHIDFRYNQKVKGDMCEVFKTEILKQYPFPLFKNEKFLSEALIWNKIALEYDTVYINKPIYVAEYLDDGLSKNFLNLVYHNPIGARENANMFLIKRFKLSIRIKNAILYIGYSKIASYTFSKLYEESNSKFLVLLFYPLGILFEFYLKKKKKKGE